MKLYRFKIFFIHLLAVAAGYCSILECYPFAVAFFAAAYLEDRYRYSVFTMVLIGMFFSADFNQIVRYGISMLIVLLLSGLLEKKKTWHNRWTQGIVAGVSLLIMTYVQRGNLILGAGEAVLICSLTVLFDLLLREFLGSDREAQPEIIHGPGKMKLMESAEVFDRLASCFEQMPTYQETFSSQDRERMSRQMNRDFCVKCSKRMECWKQNYYDTVTTTSELFALYENNGALTIQDVRGRMSAQCIRLHGYLNEMKVVFEKARTNLFWYNRLIENRAAVAGQLNEMAQMMNLVAEDIYDNAKPEAQLEDQINRVLKGQHIAVRKTSLTKKKSGRREIYITMRTKGGRCIATREIARHLSEVVGVRMAPHPHAKRVLGVEDATIVFVEDTMFRVMQGTAKAVKPGAQLSGDNETFLITENGQAVGCISDGMGSGIQACQESEQVIELLERFLEAGFGNDTAVRMINSTMLLADGEPNCSTIDVCSVDLFTGECEFLKLGATTSFVRHEGWVEVLHSEGLPVGVLHQSEYQKNKVALTDSEYVILVSDGVLEALGGGDHDMAETMLEDMILKQICVNPKEMANKLLSQALAVCKYNPPDDMTVMVLGIWKK